MDVYVGNISFEVTESDLRSLFDPYGEVTRVKIVEHRDTGSPRGFAFIAFADALAAGRAIEGLAGAQHMGRTLQVNQSHRLPGERSGRNRKGPKRDDT